MIEIISYQATERPDLAEQANQIRQVVFVDEQNVDPELEYDEFEKLATHYLLIVDGEAVATARWRETDTGIKLERFATVLAYRNQGLGAKLLQRVLEDVKGRNKKIYLHSQLMAIPFYKRFGFVKVGVQFSEAEIDHFEMILRNKDHEIKKING